MSAKVSAALDSLEARSTIPDPWVGSRYEWFKRISGAEAGKVGERVAQLMLGGQLVGRNTGYDLKAANGCRVEVKLCRKSFSKSNVWSWKQIRRADDYDDLCLIAVDPASARLFLIPESGIPASALSNQHGRGGDGALSQIACPQEILPSWITSREIA